MARLLYQQESAVSVPDAFPEEELRRYYEVHQDAFAVPEGVRIRRILIEITPDRADEAARAKALYESYVDELRMNASIEVDETRLDSIEVPPPRSHPAVANLQPVAAETAETERN
jgi:hypothetical protein